LLLVQAPVEDTIELDHSIFLLKVHSPEITSSIKPGQFLNIRVTDKPYPLLRRPFSVCDVDGEHLLLMFNVMGEGTSILAHKPKGAPVDILGPLGNGFNLDDDYDTAVVVGGGLGAAPFPFLQRMLNGKKEILTFIGGRTHKDVITYGMENLHTATDDGSDGLKGNVVDLLNENIGLLKSKRIKIFGCGPTQMFRTLKVFCNKNNFNCEVSTECAMACGFGLCQGCPIESAEEEGKYHLVCKDGPVFNINDVIL
jgi:dihydroorotate dehydrogenase electron transfer subunit